MGKRLRERRKYAKAKALAAPPPPAMTRTIGQTDMMANYRIVLATFAPPNPGEKSSEYLLRLIRQAARRSPPSTQVLRELLVALGRKWSNEKLLNTLNLLQTRKQIENRPANLGGGIMETRWRIYERFS